MEARTGPVNRDRLPDTRRDVTVAHSCMQAQRELQRESSTWMGGDEGRGLEQGWHRPCGPEEASWPQSPPRPACGFSDTTPYLSNKPTLLLFSYFEGVSLSEISSPLSID